MEKSVKSDKGEESRFYIPKRYILTALCFMGLVCVIAMRVSLSVAIVAMINTTEPIYSNITKFEVECPNLISQKQETQDKGKIGPKYNWDVQTQGLILGSFYYGNIITQLPGGLLSEKIGAKWILGGCVLNSALLNLMTPLITSWSAIAFIIVRIIVGLGEGSIYPAINVLISQWSPINERSRLSSIINTGNTIGNMMSMMISGWLCSIDLLGGWPSVFYVFGTMSCIWFIFWAVLVHEIPSEHPTISSKELKYIQENNDGPLKKKPPVPWKAIISSLPMWAVTIAHAGTEMIYLLFLAYLPTYLSTILHFNIHDAGLLSAIPFLILSISGWITSYIADRLRMTNKYSITTIRKVFESIGLLGPAVCLLIITVVGCRPYLIVVLITLGMGLIAFVFSGHNVTHMDMSPTFAGTLYAITNTAGSATGFISPVIVGIFTDTGATIENWNKVFYVTAGVTAFTAVFFAVFASAELQSWETEKEQSKL